MKKIVISGTFVCEPVEVVLTFWLKFLNQPFTIEFAPYNQIFQGLLDQNSLLYKKKEYITFLVRFEDWCKGNLIQNQAELIKNIEDFVEYLKIFHKRVSSQIFLIICPSSYGSCQETELLINKLHKKLSILEQLTNVKLYNYSQILKLYPLENYLDQYGNKLAQIPYSRNFYASIATFLARKIYSIENLPLKVIVLDCDNTLWKGICGEDGALGVTIDGGYEVLQNYMLEQFNQGKLLCLCSKNNEEDVWSVFENNPTMILKKHHIAAYKINWQRKSENLLSLANDLQLSLNSFIYIDDSPLECDEVKQNLPFLLTCQLPSCENEIGLFLKNIWCFDHFKITNEDKARTLLYQQNFERQNYQRQVGSYQKFIEGLQLEISISEIKEDEVERLQQLCHRTNQFNFTTLRYSESELRNQFLLGNHKCIVIRVKDRFGDYGLVGALFYCYEGASATILNFLLSCRVLGRTIEHKIISIFAEMLNKMDISTINIPYIKTEKNKPARDFLFYIHSCIKNKWEDFKFDSDSFTFELDLKELLKIDITKIDSIGLKTHDIESVENELEKNKETMSNNDGILALTSFTLNYSTIEKVQDYIDRLHTKRVERGDNIVLPRNELETQLVSLWEKILGRSPLGISDNFFEVGGNSLLAVQLVSLMNSSLNYSCSLKILYENKTIQHLLAHHPIENCSIYEKLPEIINNVQERYQPFPLTDVQQAYWLGRSGIMELGNVGVHTYNEYDYETILAIDRLEQSWNTLIQRHEALRLIFPTAETQLIIPQPKEYKIKVNDLRRYDKKTEEEYLNTIRNQLSHQVFDVDHWPLFEIQLTIKNNGSRLHFSYDSIAIDGWSMNLIFNEWRLLYQSINEYLPKLQVSFRDYILAEKKIKNSYLYQKHRDYWLKRLLEFPSGPNLPLMQAPGDLTKQHFARCLQKISGPIWKELKHRAEQESISPTGLLAASFSEILTLWSASSHFAINLTIHQRLPLHADINSIAGDFTSIVPLEINFNDFNQLSENNFVSRAKVIQNKMWEDIEHSLFSGVEVIRALTNERQNTQLKNQAPVVLTCILGIESNDERLTLKDFYKPSYGITQTPQVWLDFQAYEVDGELLVTWDYVEDLFYPNFIKQMHEDYCHLLDRLANDICFWKRAEVIKTPYLQMQHRENINNAVVKFQSKTLQQLFLDSVANFPNNVAIQYKEGSITYQELHLMSLKLAYSLDEIFRTKITKHKIAAIFIHKSWKQVVSCLGILIANFAYLPLDPDLPDSRLKILLKTAEVFTVITCQTNKERMEALALDLNINFSIIELETELSKKQIQHCQLPISKPHDLAYIIYTSGSTGLPKGVMIDHQGAVNTILDINHRFEIRSTDKVLALSNLNFDLSVYDIFGILEAGGTIVFPEATKIKEPEHWLELILQHKITLWNTVPMFMQMLVEHLDNTKHINDLFDKTLRVVLLSGDWIPIELPKIIWKYFGCGTNVISLGGATEASIWSIFYTIKKLNKYWKTIPYGKPLSNQKWYILNKELKHCPDYVIGDLYIGGIGLAKGYWKDDQKTRDSFILHPDTGERLYRTGDLGRYHEDGNIEFLGRDDQQIKLSGHRIELGEIEFYLNKYPAVHQAIVETVTYKKNKLLVAYIVLKQNIKSNEPVFNEVKLQFQLSQHNLRNFVENKNIISFQKSELNEKILFEHYARKSYRRFSTNTINGNKLKSLLLNTFISKDVEQGNSDSPSKVSLNLLSDILFELYGISNDKQLPKYKYPSAGSLYPVQAYIYIRDNENQKMKAGFYYYHPLEHQLFYLHGSDDVFEALLNKNKSEFIFCFIASLEAIEPIYENLSESFCFLECGYLLGLLRKKLKGYSLNLTKSELNVDPSQYLRDILKLNKKDIVMGTFCVGHPDKFLEEKINKVAKFSDELQILLYIKSNHIQELDKGLYCIDKPNNELKLINCSDEIDSVSNSQETQQLFINSHFAILFVLDYERILEPRFKNEILMKVGEYCCQLMTNALHLGLGFCPIGEIDGLVLRNLKIGKNVQFIHGLFGGSVSEDQIQSRNISRLNDNLDVIEEVKRHLMVHLPAYMVPNCFMSIPNIPITPNGKVDRKALPKPDILDNRIAEINDPTNALEKALLTIFIQHLGTKHIGIYDHFLQIGGNSLIATRIVSKIRKLYQVTLTLRTFFELACIVKIAKHIEELVSKNWKEIAPALHARKRPSSIPLSFAQQRLWFLDQLMPGVTLYNISLGLRLDGALDIDALKYAFSALINRHEILRTSIDIFDEQPIQIIKKQSNFKLQYTDLRSLKVKEKQSSIESFCLEESEKGFDLLNDSLVRSHLIEKDDEKFILLITMHHIISDGWSMAVFAKELSIFYNEFKQGIPSSLQLLPLQYADYTLWQREWLQGETLERQLNYWQNQLSDLEAHTLFSTTRGSSQEKTYQAAVYECEIPINDTQALKELAIKEEATLFMALLACFQILLFRYTSIEDIVVGTPIANRTHSEIDNLIGFFVNTLVLRNKLAAGIHFKSVLEGTRKTTNEAYDHQDVPFEQLIEHLKIKREPDKNPIFQVMFVFQNIERTDFTFDSIKIEEFLIENRFSKFDLTLTIQEKIDTIQLSFEYSKDIFDHAFIARMAENFLCLVNDIVKFPDKKIEQLKLLTDYEYNILVTQWKNLSFEPVTKTIKVLHELFEEQVLQYPNHVAIIYQKETITYFELNKRANRLAHYLRSKSVGLETIVAVCLERKSELIICILAILKAGGAYLPLDPAYPKERLTFIVQDAKANLLLTESTLLPIWKDYKGETFIFDRDWQNLQLNDQNLGKIANNNNLAYIIYTSGSTGKPKGVMVEHQNVTRLFLSSQSFFSFNSEDVWTLFHSYSFDFSVWEIWGALLYGGSLLIISTKESRSPYEIHQLLVQHKVTVFNQTPSAFEQLIVSENLSINKDDLKLRYIIFGGETLEFDKLKPWFNKFGFENPLLINMYGITETTVHVTLFPIYESDYYASKKSIIGRPIEDLQLYVLDNMKNLVPIGVPGELYVGGAGVARGYLNQPQLTSERFITNFINTENNRGEKLYKTGDLVRYLENGNLEYLGRIDEQVKLRGYRIELGEIEAILCQHEFVKQAVVLLGEKQDMQKYLVGFLVVQQNIMHTESEIILSLRHYTKQYLPEFMIPAAFVILSELPLTSNGKIDKKSLRLPENNLRYLDKQYLAPGTELEKQLASIFSELLNVNQVGIHDNFFELGGHSLLATQFISKVRKSCCVDIPLRKIFEFPTVAELATFISQSTPVNIPKITRSRERIL